MAKNADTLVGEVLNQRIDEGIIQQVNGFSDKSIKCTKILKDFNGEHFLLVECDPTGYLIFDQDTALLLEYAGEAPSPYQGIDDGLIYAGPTYYYQMSKSASAISNRITNTRIMVYDLMADANITIENLQQVKEQNLLMQQSITEKVREINNSTSSTVIPLGQDIIIGNTHSKYVSNYEYISEMDNFGFNSQGTCGYIAAGILLYYSQKQFGVDLIDSQYLYADGYTNAFHNLLVDIGEENGIGTGTDAGSISTVVNAYLDTRSTNCTTSYFFIPAITGIQFDLCFDDDKPVIIFGNLMNPAPEGGRINHAVVAFGRTDYQSVGVLGGPRYYHCHFGWTGYTNINVLDGLFVNPFGSIFHLNPLGD